MYLLAVGSIKAYGILYTEIDEHFAVGSGPLAFIGSVILFGMLGLGKDKKASGEMFHCNLLLP